MGITDFINPRDEEKPVSEVGVFCSLSLISQGKIKYYLHMHFHN